MEKRNPYAAPQAKLADAATVPLGSPVKAIVFGLLTDIVGSTVLYVLIMFLYGAYLGAHGATTAKITTATTAADGWPLYAGLAVGTIFSVVGGYVCARLPRRYEYILTGIVALLSGTFGLLLSYQQHSALVNVLFFGLGVAGMALGAYWGRRRNLRPIT